MKFNASGCTILTRKTKETIHMEEELKIIITELVNAVTDQDLLDLVYRLLLASVQSPPGFDM